MNVLSTCLFLYHVCAWYVWREVVGSLGTGFADSCESPYGCWDCKNNSLHTSPDPR